MADPELHPNLRDLVPLLGMWRGDGEGSYPTVKSFAYTEETTFWHGGRPMLGYLQRTWRREGPPSHTESGYWRVSDAGDLDVVMAHATGVVEIEVGSFRRTADGVVIDAASVSCVSAPTAKPVNALERHIEVSGDVLHYRLSMAAVGQPLTHHLEAELRRVGP